MLADRLLYLASKPVVGTYASTMLKMDVRMHERFPEGPKIIAANHPATSDPFYIAAMVRKQAFILIHETLFNVPILGEYLRRSGHIMVQPGNGPAAIEQTVKYLKEGKTIIIFPEGDLSPQDGGFCKVRTGVARIALLSGAPVIPVGIHLQQDKVRIIPSTVKGKVEYGRWYLRGPYFVTTGRPLRFFGDVEEHAYVRSVSSVIMQHIIALAHESDIRMNPTPIGLAEPI